MPASRRTTVLVKVAVILVLLAGVAYLFMRSLDVTRAEPYTVRAEHLGSWALTPDPGAEGDRAVLALAPPAELPLRLFRQVFSRAGESLSTPNMPGIALVLASELAGTALPVDGLVALAREAGLDRASSISCSSTCPSSWHSARLWPRA
ncbi:MAG: hypothetical protein AB7Q16_22995 [Vicinamibacterales bacterium]